MSKNLTQTQQKDLAEYLKSGKLGSLSNILIEHFLEEMNNNEDTRNEMNKIFFKKKLQLPQFYFGVDFSFLSEHLQISAIQILLSRTPDGQAVMPFLDVYKSEKWRTKIYKRDYDGKPEGYSSDTLPNNLLGEFEILKTIKTDSYNPHYVGLNLEDKKVYDIIGTEVSGMYRPENGGIRYRLEPNNEFLTLDHLLYREFTEALRVGKTFDEALKIITKTYILNIYV